MFVLPQLIHFSLWHLWLYEFKELCIIILCQIKINPILIFKNYQGFYLDIGYCVCFEL